MSHPELGSISHGTLRTQDLIPAFLEALREIGEHDETASAQYQQFLLSPWHTYIGEDDDSEWWDSEDAAFLLEHLIETLEEHAPPYAHFGSNEGDASDFGFWPSLDQINEDIRFGDLPARSDTDENIGYNISVSDHGNLTLYDGDKEIWAIV